MADVLGARVGRHVAPEIGWFDVYKTPEAAADARFDHWPDRWTALHWHGDAFEIPAGRRMWRRATPARIRRTFTGERVGVSVSSRGDAPMARRPDPA